MSTKSLKRVVALLCWASALTAAQRYRISEPHMGSLATITLYAATSGEAQEAFAQAFARIAELDSILSDYNPNSELSRYCKFNQPTGKDLTAILRFSQEIADETGGAFDIRIGALTRLWRQARKERRLPAQAEIEQALNRTGACAQLDAGGIAKGYAADQALAVLRRLGIRAALVAMSGDIAIGDPPPGAKGWKVLVAGRVRILRNTGVSTSGDTYQHHEVDGVRYSHIIDPRTGWALQNSSRVAVLARTAMEADAIATAVSVSGRHSTQRRGVEIIVR